MNECKPLTGGTSRESIASRNRFYYAPSRWCYKRACEAGAYTRPLLNSTWAE